MAAGDVQRLLDHTPRDGTVGVRDYAILTLLARPGLRSIEVARLLLDDVDWRCGGQTVTVAVALERMKSREPEVVTTVSPRRITAVRGFARFLSGIDRATEVPPLGLVPYNRRRGQVFLYSDGDALLVRHMGEGPARADPLDEQRSAVSSQPGITVGHEKTSGVVWP